MKKFIKIPPPARPGWQTYTDIAGCPSRTLKIPAAISRDLSYNARKRSYERTYVSGTPAIPKIPKNPANPASDNPPNTRKLS
jgi:hypothetical protein